MPVKPLAEGITRSRRVCRGVDGGSGFAGAVDDATHDRHLDRRLDVLDVLVNLVRQLEEVNLDTPAGGAGDEGGAVLAQAEALEDLVGDEDLLDRVGGQ